MQDRLCIFIALLLMAACAEAVPCRLDGDCGPRAVCVRGQVAGKEGPTGLCAPTCVSKLDCILAGRPGARCHAIVSGQGATQASASAGNRIDAIDTPLNGLMACQ